MKARTSKRNLWNVTYEAAIKSIEFAFRNEVMTRLITVLVMVALLSPVICFTDWQKAAAATLRSVRDDAPVSAPPEPFVLPANALSGITTSSIAATASTTLSSIFALISPRTTRSESISEITSESALEPSLEPNAPLSPTLFATGSVKFDFDGDGKADLARWRPSATQWQVKNSLGGTTTALTQGTSASIIAPADYDGDGKTDRAVFAPATGTWTIQKSATNTTQTITGFGQTGDKPVSGDYDGDGLADAAVYRPSDGNWYVRQSTTNTIAPAIQFGSPGDIPVAGNYDGDSKMDYAVFRPSYQYWHILSSASGYGYSYFQWGVTGDTPVPADYDGDGKTDLAVYRGSSGTWYVNKSSNNIEQQEIWGNYGDQPVPADYDGDGKADFAVWRPTTGVWHITKSFDNSYSYQTLGAGGDVPAESAYLKQIGGQVSSYDLAKTRLSPKNATGGTDLYSRNLGWSSGLVGLPGRAGLDAGFGMSYNSLVWTKQDNTMVFDADTSNISPGFRFGFPTIEPSYFDSQTGKFAYLMVTPSGARVEFRQLEARGIYETADSSYTQLKANTPRNPQDPLAETTLTVTGTDGTQMTYLWKGGAYRCSQIKDANGNYITVRYDDTGLLRTVTDTLGRIITVNYDTQLYPTSITQTWKDNNGQGSNVTHTYATFTYTNLSIDTNFGNLAVSGPANNTALKVLSKVKKADDSYTTFDYNTYGQVKQINNYAKDNHKLNHVAVNLPEGNGAQQTDCPRFTETRSYAEQFNDGNEVVIKNTYTEGVNFTLPDNSQGTGTRIEVKSPNGNGEADKLISKTFVGSSGWMESLPIVTEDWADENNQGLQRKRWNWTSWTQDDLTKTYILNPRVIESKVGDENNIKRTKIDYLLQPNTNIATYGLVSEVRVYDAYQTTVLKKSVIDYNLSQTYLDRRIIGLPSEKKLYEGETQLVSQVTYLYDEGDFTGTEQNISSVIQHDNLNFGASFIIGRGNLTSTTRHDVAGQTPAVTQSVKYNTAGAAVSQADPLGRQIEISYADAFNDTATSRNTYAYPTKLTEVANLDTNNNYSLVKYRFDFGANVWAKSPAPAGNSRGKETTRTFDTLGRLQKQSVWTEVSGTYQEYAYTRYEHFDSQNFSRVFITAVDTNGNNIGDATDEIKAETYFDGAGNVIKSRTRNSKIVGGNLVENTWIGSKTEYNTLGQIKKQYVPTEIDDNWNPAGDDTTWRETSQEYDWKGRVTREIGLDNIDRIYSYDGCGCAGGQVTTVQGEEIEPGKRRTQKGYADILGRTYKTQVLDWSANVYTTTVNTFNGRDQVVNTKHYEGTEGSTSYQEKTATYDGHGRLISSHSPEQNPGTATVYTYNADDRPHTITDARGASSTYTYNNRGLVEKIDYLLPNASSSPPDMNSNTPVPSAWPTPCDPTGEYGCPTPTPEPTPSPTPSSVTFEYDALGNRTRMENVSGWTTYDYDGLSRITAEHQKINNTNLGSTVFNVVYSYNLTGQLKSVTDPYGQRIDYGMDKAGRLEQITGTSFGSANQQVTNYINDIDYRAWGAAKQIDYGNGARMTQTFDNRLNLSEFKVEKPGEAVPHIKKTYEYYNDNRLKFSDDGGHNVTRVPEQFDRSYKYDFIGRLTEARTGIEARGGTAVDRNEVPYKQDYSYNAFGNVTSRQTFTWTQADNETNTWVNNKESNWIYDADGRLKQTPENSYYYDAAGRLAQTELKNERMMLQWYDGEGKAVQRDEYYYSGTQFLFSQTVYHVYSAVLGKLLTEVKSNGAKKRTFVYGMNGVVALQTVDSANTQEVRWEHTDPGKATYLQTGYNGLVHSNSQAELDPLGSNVGLQSPQTEQLGSGGGWGHGTWGDPFGGYSCRVDGFEMPCSFAMQVVSSGGGYFAPLGAENPFAPNGQGKFVPNPLYGNPGWSDYDWQCCDDDGKYYPVPHAHGGSSGTMTNGFLTTSFGQPQTQQGGLEGLLDFLKAVWKEYKKQQCDRYLSNLFGDEGAYFFDNTAGKNDLVMGFRPGIEHSHLYGSENDASIKTNVYIPKGGKIVSPNTRIPGSDFLGSSRNENGIHTANYILVHYEKLGKLKNVTLAILHIDDFSEMQKDGRTLVGTIGFSGSKNYGSGGALSETYGTKKGGHSHYELLEGLKWNLQNKTLLNFSDICP